MPVVDRELIEAALWKAAQDAQAFALSARDRVAQSPLCTSWQGDSAGCASARSSLVQLDGLILDLMSRIGAITSKPALEASDVDDLDGIGQVFEAVNGQIRQTLDAAYDVGPLENWKRAWAQALVDYRAFIQETARVTTAAVEDALTEGIAGAASGWWEGLGTFGQVFVLVGVYFLFIHRDKVAAAASGAAKAALL